MECTQTSCSNSCKQQIVRLCPLSNIEFSKQQTYSHPDYRRQSDDIRKYTKLTELVPSLITDAQSDTTLKLNLYKNGIGSFKESNQSGSLIRDFRYV